MLLFHFRFADLYVASEGDMPGLPQFAELRQNKDAYTFFMKNYVSSIVGKDNFRKYSGTTLLQNFVTVSDEAFAHLVIKNNYDVWSEIGNKIINKVLNSEKLRKIDDCVTKQAFFDKKGRGSTWSEAGKLYYNEMSDKIKEDRRLYGENFDNEFFNDILDEKRGRRKKRKKNDVEDIQEIECYTDVLM